VAKRKTLIRTASTGQFLLALVSLGGVAFADDADAPLFHDDAIVEVRLEAPFRTIMRERPTDEDTAAVLRYVDGNGNNVQLDVGLRTRGHFRRRPEICDFTPLRLNFKKSETVGTLFENQDKLKLVTHCDDDSPQYDQFVINEYLVYQTLNLLTEFSFRVRLLRLSYVDTDQSGREQVRLGFLIEHRDGLSERTGIPSLKTRMVTFPDLNPGYTNLASVFHYFIGNTDFSPVATAPGEDCCHNHDLFAKEGEPIYSIPYDFDMSGFVKAPHAAPNPRFGLHSVRERLYRGRCVNNAYLPASVSRFMEKRSEIYALINEQELLTKSNRKSLLKFVDRFYSALNSPQNIEKKLTRKCVPITTQ